MRSLLLRYSLLAISLFAFTAHADEVALVLGTGPQPSSDQRNAAIGIEYSFFRYERSSRQSLQVGVAYTRLRANAAGARTLHAVSVFPQLTFYPAETSKLARAMPKNTQAFFYTRMLGPTYISRSSLGKRRQANHFSLLAQIGAGLLFDLRDDKRGFTHVSWRHFSNGNLFSPNDGLDVPFVVTLGLSY